MKFNESREVDYTIPQVYSVVSGVDKYHEFVPMCSHVKCNQHESGDMLVTMCFDRASMMRFTTRVIESNMERVVSVLHKKTALLKSLTNIWSFQYINENSTQVSLDIDFETAAFIGALLETKMQKMFTMVADAFMQRLHDLYG